MVNIALTAAKYTGAHSPNRRLLMPSRTKNVILQLGSDPTHFASFEFQSCQQEKGDQTCHD